MHQINTSHNGYLILTRTTLSIFKARDALLYLTIHT